MMADSGMEPLNEPPCWAGIAATVVLALILILYVLLKH